MRSFALLLLLLVPTPLLAGTAPEEIAAMILSPDLRTRGQGWALAKGGERAVLEVIAQWGHDREAWLTNLQLRLKGTEGPERMRVQRMLDHLRASVLEHVGVDFYVVSLPQKLATEMLGEDTPDVIHGTGSAAWERWWKSIRADKAAVRHFGRSIAGIDGRPASVQVARQISYVQDMRVDEKGIVDPVIGILQAGVDMRWRPRIVGENILLGMDMTVVDVEYPLKVIEVERAGRKLEVQKPEVSRLKQRKLIALPAGGHCAWRVPNDAAAKEGRAMVVLLRAVIGRPEAEK